MRAFCNSAVEHALKKAAYGSCGCDLQKHSPTEEEGLGPGNSQQPQPQQGDPRNMFPPIGLGSQQGTGQSLQDEGGPTNPSFPTGPRLAVRRTEEIYQSPATAATPAPNTGNPSALMEHEEDNLQPKPKTSTGQAAEAQRADMKPTEAKKALLELVNSVAVFTIKSYEDRLNLAEGMSSVLDQVFNSDIGRKNPTAKIPASPGLSGSSGVYHKGYRGGDYYPDQTAVFTPAGRPNFNYDPDKVPHPHDHSPEAIRCSLCGPLIQK